MLVVLALAFIAGATSAFVGAKPFYLDAPLRFDYLPSGAGDKPILATDLDGNYVKAVAHSNQAITVTLQDGQNAQHTLSIPVGATLTGAAYAADSETLTLTLSEGDPVTADLSGLTTSAEVATAISTALAAQTDAVLTDASYAAGTENLTLTLSAGGPVTADLSGLTTAEELASAINTALDGVSGVAVTGASYAAGTELLTLTLSEGGPVTADLSGLTTSAEVATAISTALAAQTDAVLTDASYAAGTENLTLTLSAGGPVTADLSGLTTAAELSTAINAALDGVSGVTLTGASYAADSETLTLTLSEGGPVTADLSGLTTSGEVATAISTAIAAETDAVLTGASYAADSETLTLDLSEGSPVTADLSGLTTAAELATAINTALDGVSGVTVTDASYALATETLTLTLSEGGPVTADLSGLTTSAEVATAISTALAAETDAVLTDASYAAGTENLTLTLSAGGPVTADLSGLTTAAELASAINTALDGVSGVAVTGASYAAGTELLTLTLSEGEPVTADLSGLTTSAEVATAISTALAAQTDAVLTDASYAADSETLTLTLSEGGPVTADLSGLTTSAELDTAFANATANPQLLGVYQQRHDACRVFTTTDIVIPQSGWIAITIELTNNDGIYVQQVSMPVSLLHDLPVRIDDSALTAIADSTARHTANAITVLARGSNGRQFFGLTTANRLVTATSYTFYPCRVTVYTGPAVVAQSTGTITGTSFAPTTQILTLTLSTGEPVTANLSALTTAAEVTAAIDAIPAGGVTSASFATNTETLTLTLADATTVTVDLSVYSTGPEITTAISTALAAETDAVLTGATYATDTETLTLDLSEGSPVTADLSGLTTAAELSTAINAALDGVSGVAVTGASYAAGTELLTLTLSEGSPVTADLSGLTTAAELATAISTALAAQTDAVLTDASYAAGTENLTLTLSAGGPVTADLSGLTTAAELASAINTALDGVSGVAVTGASYAAGTELLTLTLSEGSPVTADLSGLTTAAELATAISTALAAQTDAVLTDASYAAGTENLTLTLSAGGPVTADLSGLTTAVELASAINTALDGVSGVTVTGATYAADSETLTLTLSEGDPITADLSGLTTSSEVATAISAAIAAETDAVLTGATYAADSETLTLTLSEGDPITADLSGLTTSSEVATAISAAIAAETDAVLTGATYAADSETLTLTLSEGSPVTGDLSGLTTAAELSTAINAALDGVSGVTLTGASYAADTETLTLTLSAGGPITADLSHLTTDAELTQRFIANTPGVLLAAYNIANTAVATALAAETDAVISNGSYAGDTQTLTFTLSEGGPIDINLTDVATDAELRNAIDAIPAGGVTSASFANDTETLTLTLADATTVTVDLSLYSTGPEVSTAITTALAAETDAVVSSASYTTADENLTLTLTEGTAITADLSDLSTDTELDTAFANATANPRLLGTSEREGEPCRVFAPTSIVIPQSGWIALTVELSNHDGRYIQQLSLPVSLLHDLPVKIDDSALTATAVSTSTTTANAFSLRVRSGPAQQYFGLTTANRLVTGSTWRYFPCRVTAYTGPAVVAQSTATVTGTSFSPTTQILTLTLSTGEPVTADLSTLTTVTELTTAITAALSAETDAVVTNATYSAETESLTLTVSEGEAITADLSGLSTDAALTAAIANATQRPRLLGSTQNTGADCQSFKPTNIVIPQTGWVTFVIELRNDNGQYIHNQSMPVSLLHNLPVKIDDTATSANVNNSTTAANALSLPVRALSDGYHVGLTTANRLVTRASHPFSPCRLSVYTGPTLTTQNTTVAYDANTRILTMTHGDSSVSTINLADHPDVTDTTTVIWGLSPDANVTIGELSDVSSQASTASLLFRAADFNGSAKYLAFALRSPSTVSSLTSTVGGTNLCNSGFWSPCTHDAQIIINNRIWDVYATSSPLTLPVDAVGLLTWE